MAGAMISLSAVVTTADGEEHDVRTNSYDLYKAEQEIGQLKSMGGEMRIGDMFAIVWSAARRLGFAGDDFEAWLSEVEIDLASDDSPEDSSPTDSPQS